MQRIRLGFPARLIESTRTTRSPIDTKTEILRRSRANSSRLHIQNTEIDPATVVFTFKNLPMVPQASSIVGIAVVVFLCVTALVAFRQAAPRVWALALSTAANGNGTTAVPAACCLGRVWRFVLWNLSIQHTWRRYPIAQGQRCDVDHDLWNASGRMECRDQRQRRN